jgi:hypothetical protein
VHSNIKFVLIIHRDMSNRNTEYSRANDESSNGKPIVVGAAGWRDMMEGGYERSDA